MSRPVPHDIDAEAHLIGACLYRNDAITASALIVTAGDFYSPKNSETYEAILGLFHSGQPVDFATVADKLAGKGLSLPEMASASSGVPASGHAEQYARIIANHAARRRLISLAAELADDAYSNGDPADLIESAVTGLRSVDLPAGRVPSDLMVLDDLLDAPVSERAPWVVPGLLRSDWRVIVVAPEGAGKALDIETPIPVPGGWKTMGELRVGDQVFDETGKPCSVTFVTPFQYERDCYEVEFSDGSVIIADADHQWWTVTYRNRQNGRWHPTVSTTTEIAGSLRARDGFVVNHAVPTCEPLQHPDADLPVDPYVLGAWLGDGTTLTAGFTSADPFIVEQIRNAGYSVVRHKSSLYGWTIQHTPRFTAAVEKARALVNEGMSVRHAEELTGLTDQALYRLLVAEGAVPTKVPLLRGTERGRKGNRVPTKFVEELRSLGVLGAKHIPSEYLTSSVEQRLALLQGLMDTDGTVSANGGSGGRGAGAAICEFSVCDERLANDSLSLLLSLGIKVTMRSGPAKLNGRTVGTRWRLAFQTDLPVFRLPRKAERLAPLRTNRAKLRYIAEVRPVPSRPVKCIQVDSPNNVYLAGEACIPTHNTLMLQQVAVCAAQGVHPLTFEPVPPVRVLVIDLENPEDRIVLGCEPIRDQVKLKVHGDYDKRRAMLWHRPGGIDLRTRANVAELEAVLEQVRPQLVVMGPAYKASTRHKGEGWDEGAAAVQRVLDGLRTRFGFALLMEDHAPQSSNGVRDLRPFGSSLWLRWPEIGLKLSPENEEGQPRVLALKRWRGDRLPNDWPERLEESQPWPWIGVWDGRMPKYGSEAA